MNAWPLSRLLRLRGCKRSASMHGIDTRILGQQTTRPAPYRPTIPTIIRRTQSSSAGPRGAALGLRGKRACDTSRVPCPHSLAPVAVMRIVWPRSVVVRPRSQSRKCLQTRRTHARVCISQNRRRVRTCFPSSTRGWAGCSSRPKPPGQGKTKKRRRVVVWRGGGMAARRHVPCLSFLADRTDARGCACCEMGGASADCSSLFLCVSAYA